MEKSLNEIYEKARFIREQLRQAGMDVRLLDDDKCFDYFIQATIEHMEKFDGLVIKQDA
jgi:hypothetical protein